MATGTPEAPDATSEHYSGPPPEPEASVYQPPAYASTSSAPSTEPSHAVESIPPETDTHHTASHDTATPSDERPARPGDVITHTHERGI